MATVTIAPERSPGAPATAISKKSVLTREPGSMDQGGATYSKEKILVPRETELGGGRRAEQAGAPNKFSIQAEAEATLIDTVQDFIQHLEDPVLITGLEPWQKVFITQFRKNATSGTKDKYDPANLHSYAEKFVKTNEGLVAALKIAEWKIALYQRATGAHIKEIQSHEVTVQPDVRMSGVDTEVLVSEKIKLRFPKSIWLLHPWETPVEKAVRKKATQEKDRHVARRDRNYYYDVEFGDKDNLRYSGGNLTQGQVAYLRSVGIDVGLAGPNLSPDKEFTNTPRSGGRNASAEQNRVGDILKRLTDARVAVYQATGKFDIDLNLAGTSGYASTPENFLRIEHAAAIGAPPHVELRVSIERQLITATAEIKKKNGEVTKKARDEIKKVREKEGKQLTIGLIGDKKNELSRGAPAVNEGDRKKIDANTEEITNESKKVGELRAAIEQGKQIPDLKKAVDDAKGLIPDFAQVEAINKPPDATGSHQPGSVGQATEDYESAQSDTAEATRRLTEAKKSREDATKNLTTLKGASPEVIQALIAKDVAAQALDIAGMETALANARVAEKAAKKLFDQRTQIKTDNEEKWQAYQNAQKTLDSVVSRQKDMAVRHGIAMTGVDMYGIPGFNVQESDLLSAISTSESTITAKTLENKKWEDPNKMAREHQRIAYEVLMETITPPDKYELMQQRIEDLDLKKKEPLIAELRMAGLYDHYPPVYLRALQVMFGWDITNYTKAAEFQKATKLLTPLMFFDLLRTVESTSPPAAPLPPIDIFDPALKDTDRMKKLSTKTMSAFVDTLLKNASKGTLGQLSPDEITGREIMQARDGSDIFTGITPTDRNNLIDILSKEIYHYEDVDDLARIILLRHPAPIPMGRTQILSPIDDAKAYAKEIVRMRNVVT